MRKRYSYPPKLDRQGITLFPSWKEATLCVSVLVLWSLPLHSQLKTRPEVGVSVGSDCSATGPCAGIGNPPLPDIPPLMKPEIVNDEKCLPWNLSPAQASTSTVKSLKVPSSARGEYQKACLASQKKKLEEAERHLRLAIAKF